MYKLIRLARAIALYFIAGLAYADTSAPVLTFGITPQHLTVKLAEIWAPICQYLSSHTGYNVQFKTSKDLQTFWQQTNEGVFDLVYITPPRYVSAHAAAGFWRSGRFRWRSARQRVQPARWRRTRVHCADCLPQWSGARLLLMPQPRPARC